MPFLAHSPSLQFQYPHRIVGGFKFGAHARSVSHPLFQYPHRIVGGFKMTSRRPCKPPVVFQYPHRIVGGFKLTVKKLLISVCVVSVSSSDRRGVQARAKMVHPRDNNAFQYPHRIVGGFKPDSPSCEYNTSPFQYPHRIVGGFKLITV